MATATKTERLSDESLAELLALTKGADSVELKLTVPVSERSRVGGGARGRSPRGPDSAGLLLRHA